MKRYSRLSMLISPVILHVVLMTGPTRDTMATTQSDPLNVLILYADDLGYGDLQIQNTESKIPTPNLNRLAKSGMRFTNGHSSSGICTPSRYALLTGRHHFRKFHGIVGPLGKSVFDKKRLTMPEMFRQSGYSTACIGKWHLGWNWDALKKDGAEPKQVKRGNTKKGRPVWTHDAFDWSRKIPDGPLDHGFDYYFGDTVINFPPYCWIENDRVVRAPDSTLITPQGKPKEGSWEVRPGPARSDWDFYDALPTLTQKGVEYIESRQGKKKPFFLYFAFPSPHAPIVPTDEFQGRSKAGAYGDFVVQTDDCCGRLLAALKKAGLEKDTIVVLTSDNGPERYAYARDIKFDHWSSRPFRGLKRDLYEGGHHVPLIIRWPRVTQPNQVNSAMISQTDLMATFAATLNFELPKNAAEDSFNQLPVLMGKAPKPVRTTMVHNTFKDRYAIRDGNWLLINTNSGYHSQGFQTWEKQRDYENTDAKIELYDLKNDVGQKQNVAREFPQKVKQLQQLIQTIRKRGFTAPRLQK